MDFIIAYRNTSNNLVGFVTEDDGETVAIFKDQDEAERVAIDVPICRAFPYEVIELNV